MNSMNSLWIYVLWRHFLTSDIGSWYFTEGGRLGSTVTQLFYLFEPQVPICRRDNCLLLVLWAFYKVTGEDWANGLAHNTCYHKESFPSLSWKCKCKKKKRNIKNKDCKLLEDAYSKEIKSIMSMQNSLSIICVETYFFLGLSIRRVVK